MKLLFGLCIAAGFIPQEGTDLKAIRDYAFGETDRKPDLAGTSWEDLRKAMGTLEYSKPENLGREVGCTHTLTNGSKSTFFFTVPKSYDPRKAAPVVFFLHGGVGSPAKDRGEGQGWMWKELAEKEGWITCSPSGHDQCMWWNLSGEEHLLEALRFLSAGYHVDRNRVYLSGFSDGATGIYSLGMRLTDQWAACIPWNGSIGVVTSKGAGNTPFYTANCKSVAWRATHGGRDKLYPASTEEALVSRIKDAGGILEWKNYEKLGHEGGAIIENDLPFLETWLPKQKRDPLPREIDWTTHDPQNYGRSAWVRIVELGGPDGDPFAKEKNFTIPMGAAGMRPVLGVQMESAYEGPGAKVSSVSEGSGAEDAGVKAGDLILSLDGTTLATFEDLRNAVSKMKSGQKVKLAIQRGEEKLEIEVTIRPIEAKVGSIDVRKVGRLRATRDGNAIDIKAKGVGRFEILVSPDAFDLSKEIVVTVNGREKVRKIVTADPGVLVEEIRGRKGDTSVPYAARIQVTLPK